MTQCTNPLETFHGYVIRPSTEEDLGEVRAFLRPFVENRQILHRTRAELAVLLHTGFVVECEGRIVGFSAVEIYSKKLAEIQCLAVAPEHRCRGLGHELVRRCVELARQRGVMEVMAISSSEKLLRDVGFDYSLPDQKRALFCQLRSREEVYRQLEGEDD
ncbi:MAG: N-acetylglutamate synthase [Pirellulaceae bacterium]|nr:MAG: N-acetylglutamate synthase [Pirellulaceae bacterium]